jgi:hypothetical protein
LYIFELKVVGEPPCSADPEFLQALTMVSDEPIEWT